MWSETVGLRTRPVSEQKIGLGLGLARCGPGLGLQVRCCVVKHGHHQHTSTQLFYRPDALLSPNLQCQSTDGKVIPLAVTK